MDLRTISSAIGSSASILAQSDFTIVGDCRGEPALELTEQASSLPLLPLRAGQCLLLIDEPFVEARRGGIAVALADLYLRVLQFDPDRTSGAVASNGADVWLSGVTLHGERALGGQDFGTALNLYNQTRMHVADSTLTGWHSESGAIAVVDAASSIVFDNCEITGNGVPDGVLILTSKVAAFTPSTVVVKGGTVGDNEGAFYGVRTADMGLLYADAPLFMLSSSSSGAISETPALPLDSIDEGASAPILQPEDSPLLADPSTPEQERSVAPPEAPPPAPPSAPPVVSTERALSGGGSRGAAYTVFVIVCVAGMVLIGCMLCALAVCVVRRYKAAQRKEWMHFHDQPDTNLQLGTLKQDGDTGALAASYHVPATAAAAGAAYAAHATGDEPRAQLGADPAAAPVGTPYFEPQSQPLPAGQEQPPWPPTAAADGGPGPGQPPPESLYAPTETDAQSRATEQQLLR